MATPTKLLLERGSTLQWSSGAVLTSGEPGYNTTSGELKIGDGSIIFDV